MLNRALTTVRATGFWRLDALRGNLVKNSYEEIKRIDGLDSDHAEVKQHQASQFKKLAEHAVNTTQFYKQFNDEISLDAFPVINKNIIVTNQNDFISNKYDKDTLIQMSTSGSTGTPFVSYQNKLKKRRVNAEIIYYGGKAGYSVGKKLIFLRSLTEKTEKTPLKLWIQNETLIGINDLKDENIEVILSDIVKASKNGAKLLAYSSTYDAFKSYFERNNIDLLKEANIEGAVGGAEMLCDDTRQVMEETFKCRVYSRYSNQENGVIGQDDKKNNVFILNEANYIVEIFDLEIDELVSEGEVGRIVLTDLYNTAMPMIRYDTGDIGAITRVKYNGVLKKAISSFGGRKEDIVYDIYGNRLAPGMISMKLGSFPMVKQFQFIQEGKKQYKVKINSDQAFDKKELKNLIYTMVGEDANITIEIVNEIPVMSSGKRKAIENRLSK